jgi:hypothetical protein
MVPRTVNIVGTRCTEGDHRAAQAWYADHVHQLFAFEGLLAARLVQRVDGLNPPGADGANAAAPEYLCSYDFASEASFQAFESSGVRAAAAADRERGWGRVGIEITQRRAWLRRYQREGAAPATLWQVQCAALPPAQAAGHTEPGALPRELLRDPLCDPLRDWIAGHEGALELYEASAPSPSAAPELTRAVMVWTERTEVQAASSTALRPDWKASYRLLWRWRR